MGRRKSYQVPIGYKDPGGKKVKNRKERDFPGGPVVKNLPANAGDTGWIPGPGRFHMPQSS